MLLTIWVSRGDMRQREGGRIRPALILSHFGLAAIGLVLWIMYVVNDSDTLAWIAFAPRNRRRPGLDHVRDLVATSPVGRRRGRWPSRCRPAEQHFQVRLWQCTGCSP